MLEIDIPGGPELRLDHLVLDFNGTIAVDGEVIPGVRELMESLASRLAVHVLTADTHGQVRDVLADYPCQVEIIGKEAQDRAKLDFVDGLGRGSCVAVGNGQNDARMLEGVALGIAVMQTEGIAVPSLMAADVACTSIQDALGLLVNPLRLKATLRR